MGNRSRFVTVAAGSAAAVAALTRARRRARLASATEGFVDDIMPSVLQETPSSGLPVPSADEAHAPGHRHLHWSGTETDEPAPRPVRVRPLAKHRRGLRHPGRG